MLFICLYINVRTVSPFPISISTLDLLSTEKIQRRALLQSFYLMYRNSDNIITTFSNASAPTIKIQRHIAEVVVSAATLCVVVL